MLVYVKITLLLVTQYFNIKTVTKSINVTSQTPSINTFGPRLQTRASKICFVQWFLSLRHTVGYTLTQSKKKQAGLTGAWPSLPPTPWLRPHQQGLHLVQTHPAF